VNGALSLCAVGLVACRCINWSSVSFLWSAKDIIIVPHYQRQVSYIQIADSLPRLTFTERCETIVKAALACRSSIIPRPRTSNKGNGTVPLLQNITDLGISVCCLVGWFDMRIFEPLERWHTLVVHDSCLKEVDNFFMLLIFRPITCSVKSRKASGMLAKFMAPESSLVSGL